MSLVRISVLMACCLCAVVALAADTITGTVHNQTTRQPAGGDDVVLLRLGQETQEEARTKTDAQGAFSLNITDAQAPHAVRVIHQGVDYDQNVTGAGPLEIRVFNSVPKVAGLSGNIGVAQIEPGEAILKVTEMYSITNASSPPVTQSGRHSFEISIPAKAALDSLEVRNEAGNWVKMATAPRAGHEGRYLVHAPLRPGETVYKFAYHLPYKGPITFHLRLAYPIKNFAVSLPPSLSLRPSLPGTFRVPGTANGFQLYAASQSVMTDVPAFVVFGAGVPPPPLPPVVPNAAAPPPVSVPPAAAAGNPNSHAEPAVPDQSRDQSPNQSNDQSKKDLWPILSLIVAVLAVGIFSVWRMRRNVTRAAAPGKKTKSEMPLLDALKEELFQLESDRLHGSISPEEYTSAKAALNESIQRALARSGKT